MTGAERVRRYRLKHRDGKSKQDLQAELARTKQDLQSELARTVGELSDVRSELAKERKRREAAEVGATASREVLERLRHQLNDAQARVRLLEAVARQNPQSGKGMMSATAHREIIKALHPDSRPSEADRAEACRLFNAWVDGLKPSRAR